MALYVIAEEDDSPLSSTAYDRLWRSLKSHIELYGMTAINFRTTFATMAVASGVDIRATQALMGHATPEMTLKVYTKKEEKLMPTSRIVLWHNFAPVLCRLMDPNLQISLPAQ